MYVGKPKQTGTGTASMPGDGNSIPSTLTTSLAPTTHTTSTPIVAPSEVLPNTAISDRPKVKSVSKKDNKNIRKATAAASALQSNQLPTVKSANVSLIIVHYILQPLHI